MTINKTAVTAAVLGVLSLAAFSGSAVAQESNSTPQAKPHAAGAAVQTTKDKTVDKLAIAPKAKLSTDTNYSGHKFEKQATIKLPAAREIALKERPGTITDFELEQEKGGSGLRYSFDIRSDKVGYEVGVDANTGKVLENTKDGPRPD